MQGFSCHFLACIARIPVTESKGGSHQKQRPPCKTYSSWKISFTFHMELLDTMREASPKQTEPAPPAWHCDIVTFRKKKDGWSVVEGDARFLVLSALPSKISCTDNMYNRSLPMPTKILVMLPCWHDWGIYSSRMDNAP